MPFLPSFAQIRPHSAKSSFRMGVSAFFFIQGIIFATWASRIPDIKQALSLNDGELGSVLLAMPLAQLSCMALSGYLVNHFGSRRVLPLAEGAYALALTGISFAQNFWQLFAILAIFGICSNTCNIAVNTQAVGVERLYKRSIMAMFHGLWSLAGFLGGLAGALVVAVNMDTKTHFMLISLLSLLFAFIQKKYLMPRDDSCKTCTPKESAGKGLILPDAYLLVLGLIAFGSMASEGTMFDWSSVYFESVIQPEREFVRLGYITAMCTMVCGRFLADRLVMHFGVMRVLQMSGLCIALGLSMAVYAPSLSNSLPLATLGMAFLGFGTSSVVPLCYSLAGKSARFPSGTAIAIVSTIGFLGFLITPPMIGFIAQLFSLRAAFAVIAVIGFLIALAAPFLRKQQS